MAKRSNDVSSKPVYKKWWFWVILIFIIGAIGNLAGEGGKKAETNKIETKPTISSEKNVSKESNVNTQESKPKDDGAPADYKSALKKAESYAKIMQMSKAGIYDQLTSEYGEKFPPEAAQYAIDNVKADWNANALAKAKNYQETMSMSTEAIRDQLTSEYGEKFTPEEAEYAIQNLDK